MAACSLSRVVQHLRRVVLLRDGGGLTDGELLDRFLTSRDEAAFAALVRRHGPMVMGVCRRVLGNSHDAEDAFQSTFVVLVRRAAAVVPRDLVGNWLHGVAYRTSLEARATRARRQSKENRVAPRDETPNVLDELVRREQLQLLDEELTRLPERYRVPVVLCDLGGKTHQEAARLLDCPEATLSTRLRRARQLLARRLANRGVVGAGAMLTALLSDGAAQAGVPAPLVAATIHAATAVTADHARSLLAVARHIETLTKGGWRTMSLHCCKTLIVIVALVCLVGSGAVPRLTERAALAGRPAALASAAERTAQEKGPAPVPAETLRQLEGLRWYLLRGEAARRTLHIAEAPATRLSGSSATDVLLASAAAQLSLRDLPVAQDAVILFDGKKVELKDLRAGVILTLKLAANRLVVTAITATKPEPSGYVVMAVHADKQTIVVARGQGAKTMSLAVAPNALLRKIDRLQDLKVGMHVALHIDIVDGKMIVKDLRVR
jgi:RNA polymerase sigma factor (sigma-70 family)